MSSSYERVRGSKLTLKGGPALQPIIGKKKKKKKTEEKSKDSDTIQEGEAVEVIQETYQVDTGTGHAPDGKKSKKYEELFPVEAKRFGYPATEVVTSREVALDERVKKKADRYCK